MRPALRLLRVACVGNDRRGGMSRTMHLTGDHLKELGFAVDYLFAESFSSSFSARWRRFTGPWEAAAMIKRQIEAEGPYDVIEVHEPLALGSGVMRKIWRQRTKIVAFSYGIEERCRPITLNYQKKHGLKIRLKSRFTGWLQGRQSAMGLRFCDHVVCSNQEDVDYLSRQGFSREQLTVHHSGVDSRLMEWGDASPKNIRRDILFLGSWIDRKGIFDIVPALIPILRENIDLQFTVAGCQTESDKALCSFPQDIHHQIQVIPRVQSDEELAQIYSSHGIFLLPSYFEGQPLVMMEAAAFGLAIITTPICGMLDFIRNDENGVFVPVGNPSAIETQLRELLANPTKISQLGEAAKQDVKAHTWEASAKNLAETYRKLANQA